MAASIEQAAGEAGSDGLAALLRVALNDDGTLQGGSSIYNPGAMPALGWDAATFPLTVGKIASYLGSSRKFGAVNLTPESVFDSFSTARSAPTTTYFVATTGNDANNGLTVGAPFQSIWKAVLAANATGQPAKIIVSAGVYYRNLNPWYNGGAGVVPTVDLSFIASGGRVVTGTFDAYAAPTRDATQVNTYSFALTSAQRVYDTVNLDRFGNYTELIQVSTAALCNSTPNTWALVAGTVFINRGDQIAVTRDNTHVYRPATNTLRVQNEVNVYLGGATLGDGFDLEGSQGGGALHYTITTPSNVTRKVVVARDCSFKYGGGYTDTSARCVSIESLYGLAFFLNCRSDAAVTDGFNFHNTNGATKMHALTVNCTGHNNGSKAPGSNQGWTSHENVIGIDVAGYYKGNHGGTIRSINTSKSWLVGTVVEDDFGDLEVSGSVPPTAFRVDDTATYWCENTGARMAAAGYAYVTGAAGATINQRNVEPTPLPNYGTGTFGTF